MNLWVLFILNYTIYMTFYWHLKASPFMPCNLSFATISISIYFKAYMKKYIWHVKRFTLIMTCLSWCTFTNLLYCNITVASWHLSIHDVKPVLCHNLIHIEAYLMINEWRETWPLPQFTFDQDLSVLIHKIPNWTTWYSTPSTLPRYGVSHNSGDDFVRQWKSRSE